MQCLQCGKIFKERRKTAKYCSKKCNTYFNRKFSTTDENLPPVVSTTKPLIKPLKKVSTTIPPVVVSRWDEVLKKYE